MLLPSADPDPAAGGSDGTAVGMLVPCKFDPQVQPMSTIFYAFEEYCRELLATGNDALIASVRADVLRGLGTGRDNLTLVSLIPTLGRLLGIADAAAHQNEEVTAEAFNRIVYSLRVFVRSRRRRLRRVGVRVRVRVRIRRPRRNLHDPRAPFQPTVQHRHRPQIRHLSKRVGVELKGVRRS